MKSFFDKLLFLINAGIIIFTLVTYLSKYISPNVFWPISITGVFFPWMIIFNIVFILIWLYKRNKNFLLSLMILIVGAPNISTYFNINSSEPKTEKSFKVLSYNVAGLRGYNKSKNKEEWVSDFAKELNQSGAVEIMSLQEVGGNHIDALKKGFNLPYAYRHPHLGTAIISKFPILKSGVVEIGKTANSVVWADLKLSNKNTIRVYSVHLQSNQITSTANSIAEKPDLENKETYRKIGSIFKRYKTGAQKRDKQAHLVLDHIVTSKYPTIVTGDFNDTPQSIVYSNFTQIMKDGFVEKGSGIGVTFGGTIPLLRIDYIFSTKNFKFLDYEILGVDYSDHYPVLSDVEIE